jgi:hypothetical protein
LLRIWGPPPRNILRDVFRRVSQVTRLLRKRLFCLSEDFLLSDPVLIADKLSLFTCTRSHAERCACFWHCWKSGPKMSRSRAAAWAKLLCGTGTRVLAS